MTVPLTVVLSELVDELKGREKLAAAIAEKTPAEANSPMKNRRNLMPEYSVRYPVTSSDSATGMSNGACVSSA